MKSLKTSSSSNKNSNAWTTVFLFGNIVRTNRLVSLKGVTASGLLLHQRGKKRSGGSKRTGSWMEGQFG